jgi:hypothetical protein
MRGMTGKMRLPKEESGKNRANPTIIAALGANALIKTSFGEVFLESQCYDLVHILQKWLCFEFKSTFLRQKNSSEIIKLVPGQRPAPFYSRIDNVCTFQFDIICPSPNKYQFSNKVAILTPFRPNIVAAFFKNH